MELVVPRGDNPNPQYAKVTKRLRDADGIPIGKANENPILDSCMYKVEYQDGMRASLVTEFRQPLQVQSHLEMPGILVQLGHIQRT